VRELADAYHPNDLETGRAQPPQRARERIAKAERLTTQLLATVAFFFATILRTDIETVASECADLFHGSSSFVEGRNGQLALHHHVKHRLSTRRLAALTAIHNHFIRRPDGTTAAERFFAHAPPPMFDCLIRTLDPPPRPARKRPRAPRPAYPAPLAA